MQTPPRKHVFTAHIPMRWGDMDAFGHINNTLYFRYSEQARSEWMASLFGTKRPPGHGLVLASTHCNFLKPLTYPGTLEVRMLTDPPGRTSLMTWFELRLSGDETLYAEGGAKMVWMDLAAGRPIPLPDVVLRAVKA
jgi:acyl-CoA thioester hydrolase